MCPPKDVKEEHGALLTISRFDIDGLSEIPSNVWQAIAEWNRKWTAKKSEDKLWVARAKHLAMITQATKVKRGTT